MLIEQTRRDFIKKTFGAAVNAATGGMGINPLKKVGELLNLTKDAQEEGDGTYGDYNNTFDIKPIIGKFVSYIKGEALNFDPNADKFIQHIKMYTGVKDNESAVSYGKEFVTNLLKGEGSIDLTFLHQILPLSKPNIEIIKNIILSRADYEVHEGDSVGSAIYDYIHHVFDNSGIDDPDDYLLMDISSQVYEDMYDSIKSAIYVGSGLDENGIEILDWKKHQMQLSFVI